MAKSFEGVAHEPEDGHRRSARGARSAGGGDGVATLLVGPVLLVVAAVIVFAMPRAEVPSSPTPLVRTELLTDAPLRTPLGDPPRTFIAGFERRCNECHSIIEPGDSRDELLQHQDIKLAHGLNDDCYNCHARDDREKLVLRDGSMVGYAQSVHLCAQCHGRMYRDWTRGAHGKTLGSWDRSNPAFRRLTCVQCHDPHAPMMPPLEPMPGPKTLRMGEPAPADHSKLSKRRNPLLMWSIDGAEKEGGDH
ncbi:MAG: hypothetical protein D6695_10920 [Planctomycetota bacterium]|nr:MAG: hypothetical protein D6695_10920 [Planctomycetota bacterium]